MKLSVTATCLTLTGPASLEHQAELSLLMLRPHLSHFTAEETEDLNTLSEALQVAQEVRDHRLGTMLLTTAILLLFGKEGVYPHPLAESQGSYGVTP